MNAYLVHRPGQSPILVDAGAGSGFEADGRKICLQHSPASGSIPQGYWNNIC